MLYNPYSYGFRSLYDNLGATLSNLGMGTSTPAPASVNTKAATVQLISGATVLKDCYGISVIFNGGATSAAVRGFLVDVMVDPAGGTAWSVLIPNLLVCSPDLGLGGYRYHFPLKIKAGSSIGVAVQSQTASAALRTSVQLYGEPERPENLKFGTYVQAFGPNTATSFGVAITPTTSNAGTYLSLGNLTKDAWWWQWGGISSNDTTMTTTAFWADIACGDATTKKICMDMCVQNQSSTESVGKDAFGLKPPVRWIKSGTGVYVRVGCNSGPDTACTTAVYAVG